MSDDGYHEIEYDGKRYVRKGDDGGLFGLILGGSLLLLAFVLASAVLVIGFTIMMIWRPIAAIGSALPLLIILGLVYGMIYLGENYFEIPEIVPAIFLVIAIIISALYAYVAFFPLMDAVENLELVAGLYYFDRRPYLCRIIYISLNTITVILSLAATVFLLFDISDDLNFDFNSVLYYLLALILLLAGPAIALAWRFYKHPLAEFFQYDGRFKKMYRAHQ